MKVKSIAIASVLAAVFAGNAFAAQPESGEGPLFLNEAQAVSTLTREAVTQQAIANPPAVNGYDAAAAGVAVPSQVSRSAVRDATRDAIAHGFRVKSGEMA